MEAICLKCEREEPGMKKVIYYFSGTGNSLRAAVKIAARLGDTEIISMRNDPSKVPATDCDVIGFIYPVYHWTMPEPAYQFVKALSINPSAYIFAVAMPSLVLGYACEKLAKLLDAKGAALAYGTKVSSVANYALVYPPFPSPHIVVPRAEKKLDKIAAEVASGLHKDYPRAGALVKRKYAKVMPQYKALQPFADRPFTVSDDCVSCGLCARICPCGNIKMMGGKPEFLHHCAQCMACVSFCPRRAIGYSLSADDLAELQKTGLHVPVVRKMGLPAERKLYRNPFVSAGDLVKNKIKID